MTHQLVRCLAALLLPVSLWGGTYGKLAAVRGMISDLALDERRGVLYAANMTANRIELIRTDTAEISGSMAVGEAPSTLALSPDQRFLVIGHFGGGVTIQDLDAQQRRVLTMPAEVLAVAFGKSIQAFVVTGSGFFLLDPQSGTMRALTASAAPGTGTIGVPPGSRPPDLVRASAGVSGDGNVVYVAADTADTAADSTLKGNQGSLLARYQVNDQSLTVSYFTSVPPFGPRQVSVDETGATVLDGWGLLNTRGRLYLKGQLANITGQYGAGGHAFDWRRKLIYAQAPIAGTGGKSVNDPWLHVLDPDSLAVREILKIPSPLGGKTVITADGRTLFAVAQSGVVSIPLDTMPSAPRLVADQDSILIAASWCDSGVLKRTLKLSDPSGKPTDFRLSFPADVKGLRVYPTQGVTPAEVTIEVDPAAFRVPQGTTVVPLTLTSSAAANIIEPIPLYVSVRESGRQGRVVRVPGRLVDILADPVRDRFYVLRQDRNLVLAFDARTQNQIASAPTANTPTQMTITADGRYMIVGANNAQIASVIDLDSMTALAPIEFPFGQYPRSVAATGGAILAATRSVNGPSSVYRIDFNARTANAPARLGIFANKIHEKSVLAAAWRGATAMLVQPDGAAFLYEAASDAWVSSRKDFPEFKGALAVFTDDWFLAGNALLDRSLYPVKAFPATETVAGAVHAGGNSYIRTVVPKEGFSYVERADGWENLQSRFAQLVEPPVGPLDPGSPIGLVGFDEHLLIRSLAIVPASGTIVTLSTSGVVVLDSDFDQARPQPSIASVVSAADGSSAIGPGSLILIRGSDLSPAGQGAVQAPWPSALGEVCVQGGGALLPLARVSASEILAQLPYQIGGTVPFLLRTPSGAASFSITVAASAPAIFRSPSGTPLIVRWKNQETVGFSNPIHGDDNISIYMTGLGPVTPELVPGAAAPATPPTTLVRPVRVVLSGEELPLWFAGAVPGEVGVYRIDARVPWWLRGGNDVPLSIEQGAFRTIVPVRLIAK